ncbi:hypothetical protein [Telluria beijingensis]|uniref:hypothetical protein n=1 Tax=Telluria beijingensis TaxID=3068633 RepID=UPI002795C20B|nr:hypothetical protein [Massilia sp. REN29]
MKKTMQSTMGLVAGILLGILSCVVQAATLDAQWQDALNDAGTLQAWRFEADAGDAEKQERLAQLFLGPRGRALKAGPYEGAHFLLRAATNGRRASMLQLSAALDKGAFGFRKLPDAARCWSRLPAGFEQRLACVSLTDVRDPRARVACTDLIVMREEQLGADDGVARARLCLANKTPALLVPGPPPGKRDEERVRLYRRHGIEVSVTGDVYEEAFEKYRNDFNKTMIAGIEAERGPGYLDRLGKDIEASLDRRFRGK